MSDSIEQIVRRLIREELAALLDDDFLRSMYPPIPWWSLWTAIWGHIGAQMLHRWPAEVWGL